MNLIDQVVAKYSVIWLKIEWVVNISEKYWIKIHFKNNWKVTNAKLKYKSYSVSFNEHAVIDKTFDKLYKQEKTYWIQSSAFYAYLIFMTWQTVYKNEKLIQKEWAIINLWKLNHVTVSDVYSLLLQSNIITLILSCKYISMMNRTDFFYQWQVTVKDHKKFIIVSHCDLKTINVALMSYQKFHW